MGLHDTPSANRIHIGFFGVCNAGKSSVVNAVTGQELSIVSEVRGTTTDPVYKAMELLPLGPVMVIDTPGFDDTGALGELRVRKTKQILNKTDVAILVVDAVAGKCPADEELLRICKEKHIPYLIAYNKSDLTVATAIEKNAVVVSALTKSGIHELKERIAKLADTGNSTLQIVGDLIHPLDFVVLVTPIDSAAPKGRMILPQQQVIRDVLEADATAIVVKEFQLHDTLASLGKRPALVVTDSQVFAKVSADTPDDIPLTSFSILMARYKGFLDTAVRGAVALDTLADGDTVLISEGCTHHRQCEDIGTVKLPKWIKAYTQRDLHFAFTSGTEFPDDLSPYRLIIHCGGCMLTEREMQYRMKCAMDQEIPFTNYGTSIAHIQGILERSLSIFTQYKKRSL